VTLLGGEVELRRGGLDDVEDMLAIKRALPMSREGPSTRRGGFILGSDLAGYRQLVTMGRVWLLRLDGRTVGYSTAYPDPVLRASELWSRQERIDWVGFDPATIVDHPIALFDQLAVLPGSRPRFYGTALALRAMLDLLCDHRNVLTTVVHAPVRNLAALAFVHRLGGRLVGELPEHYPEVGEIRSGLYCLDGEHARRAIDEAARDPSVGTRRILALCQLVDDGEPPA
jgi:ribosomal protein S18 acetylase RimI-like enzyme